MNVVERWRHEREAAWLSGVAASSEADERKSRLFRDLERAALEQAGILERDAAHRGIAVPAFVPSARARVVAALTRAFGTRRARPMLAAMKVRGLSVYLGDSHPEPSTDGAGESHGRSSGNLRAAVFGVNDGLVSNLSLIMGVAGAASGQPKIVIASGIAGLLAGAFSMASGEWISVRSQRELFEHQIGQERDELERYPQDEAEELALIFEARGVPAAQAREQAARLVEDPQKALDLLAREELGLDPDALGSPWGAALSSFLAFALGAFVPLVPFALGMSQPVLMAAVMAGVALVVVGMALSLFSGRNAAWGGLRMLLIGAAAATATWVAGRLVGNTIG